MPNFLDLMAQSLGGTQSIAGMIEPPTVKLFGRKPVRNNTGALSGTNLNPNFMGGTSSTVRSMSFQDEPGGPEILIPTVADGKLLTPQQAIERYRRTGEHMGKFISPEYADMFAAQYHNDAAAGKYNSPRGLSLQNPMMPTAQAIDLALGRR